MSANVNAANQQPTLLLLARIFIAALFLVAGARKLLGYAGDRRLLREARISAPDVIAVLAIVIELGAGLMLATGWRTRWAAWLLVVFVAVRRRSRTASGSSSPRSSGTSSITSSRTSPSSAGCLFVATFGPGRMALDKG